MKLDVSKVVLCYNVITNEGVEVSRNLDKLSRDLMGLNVGVEHVYFVKVMEEYALTKGYNLKEDLELDNIDNIDFEVNRHGEVYINYWDDVYCQYTEFIGTQLEWKQIIVNRLKDLKDENRK